MSPSPLTSDSKRGYIIPIGGAEEKFDNTAILDRFVELCGGRSSRIAIIPTASQLEDTGERYKKLFSRLGAEHVRILPFATRADCQLPNDQPDDNPPNDDLKALEEAQGVFMTGGNQLRLSTTIGGTTAARLIRRLNAAGLHVAGTSAGAAFMPEHMIAGGKEGSTPSLGMVRLAPGLGLTNKVIIDQHFRQRDRLGRLLTALAYNPFATGIGLDEDTAAFIQPDDCLEVVGSGGITVVDPTEIEYSSMDQTREGEPVSLLGVRLHILVSGGRFDLTTRKAYPG